MLIFFQFPSFIFKEDQVIVQENNPSQKNVTEELDGIDIDDIGNLEDLLRLVSIHEECGSLKVFVVGRELTRHINEKKRCTLGGKCFMQEYFCSKHVKYCESEK